MNLRSPHLALRGLDFGPHIMLGILAVGILARIVVFYYLGPFNNDNHFEIIRYIVRKGALPRVDQFNQAYHPPLYYLLASFFLRWGGSQNGSVFFAHPLQRTLLLAYRLICWMPWISRPIKPWCLALIAFHPQFLLYSLFISNDNVAIFIGMLIFDQCRRVLCVRSPAWLCLAGGVAWPWPATRATFLIFILPLAVFVFLLHADRPAGRCKSGRWP